MNMDKKWLDKICEDGIIKCYLESEILNRTFVGHGGFGVVYKAQLKYNDITVAMKMLSLNAYSDEQELYKKFVNEVCGYYCCCLSQQEDITDNKYLFILAD